MEVMFMFGVYLLGFMVLSLTVEFIYKLFRGKL
jgi:hypothetical protein